MDVERLAKELILKGMTSEQQKAVLDSIKSTMTQAREVQKQRIGENVQVVVQALKKIEGDIRSRYDEVGNKIEKRVASLKDGQDGRDGKDGKDGKDGRPGRDGAVGPAGARGTDGLDGRDGEDGVSVTDAHIDFDGSLTITLSNGREINVGEVVAPDLAERIKVITNGGGTSQYVMDALESLENVILGAGTANGVAFLNASKVLVTGSALTFDGATFANTAGTIAGAGLYSNATGGEGGQLSLANPTNTGNVATFDVLDATTARLFTTVNNAALLIGQLAGTGGVVSFYTNSTERMRIDSAGNVGIGTSTPTERLDLGNGSLVLGTAIFTGRGVSTADVALELGVLRSASGNVYIDLHATAGTDYSARSVRFAGTNGEFQFLNTGTGALRIRQEGAASIVFDTNSTERMRIDSSGNVGIGTSAPGDKLEIGGSGAGIILASPDGTRYRITVSNLGVLTVAAV